MPELAFVPRPDRSLRGIGIEEGLGGIKNGELLTLAEKEFDVFITGDRNLSFQQAVGKFDIAVIVLHSASTQLHHTLPLMAKVLAALPKIKPGEIVNVYP